MSNSKLHLRQWQRAALDKFQATNETDFLTVATPGAGKTTFALVAARLTLPNLPGRLVVVCPTSHLKQQWASAASRFDLQLVTNWSPGDRVPDDAHGVVTTYQQVGSSPAPFFQLSQGGFVILDEIHHAGEERSWGDGVRSAFDASSRRLALSGTPFRSDTNSIPFVRYEYDVAQPDFDYGYGPALSDGSVVRPVYFPRFGGQMEWTSNDGSDMAASFDDALARTQSNQRLRAALSLEGEWLPAVLGHAHERLATIRKNHKDAGGLVITMDQDHARGVSRLLKEQYKVNADVVTSDDPKASEKITKFSEGRSPWIVAVKMISEGVDIPRLRVGVYATTTTTELFFRQAVGRVVRHIPGAGLQRAYMFIPDDYRLRKFGAEIGDSRKHSLTKKTRDGDELDSRSDPTDQMSLFAVKSATLGGNSDLDVFAEDESVSANLEEAVQEELVLDLGALPSLNGSDNQMSGTAGALSASHDERARLRRINKDLTTELVQLTGRTPQVVNGELNRLSGVKKVSEATILQLNKRSRVGEEWLRREHRRARFRNPSTS